VLGHGVEELVGGRVEPVGAVGGDVLAVVELHLLIVRVGGGGEEVPAGEADEARVVEDGGALVEGAQLLRGGEAGIDAVMAGGCALVAAALPEGIHDVRRRPDHSLGEEGGGRGDVAWQGGGDQAEVAAVGAVGRVVPRDGAVARLPRYTSHKLREGQQQTCRNH